MSINDNDVKTILTECAEACGDETLSSLWQISTNMRDLKAERDSLRAELESITDQLRAAKEEIAEEKRLRDHWFDNWSNCNDNYHGALIENLGLISELDKLKEQKPIYQYSNTHDGNLWTDCNYETYSIMKNNNQRIVYAHPVPAQQDEPNEWNFCPECGSEEIHYQVGTHKQCKNCHQEYWSDTSYFDVLKKHLNEWYRNSRSAQQSPAVAVPEGYKLMPIEPTGKMHDAAWSMFGATSLEDLHKKLSMHDMRRLFKIFYKVILSAHDDGASGIDYKAQRDELLALLIELREVSSVATKEMTTVRGDFVDWFGKVQDAIAKCDGAKL